MENKNPKLVIEDLGSQIEIKLSYCGIGEIALMLANAASSGEDAVIFKVAILSAAYEIAESNKARTAISKEISKIPEVVKAVSFITKEI